MSDKDINKMDFKELRNEVQLLRDELARMKRTYEDILYNLDTENFSSKLIKEKEDMKTEISVTAEGIKTKVSKSDLDEVLEGYSSFEQTAESILATVYETYETKDGAAEKYSTIEQTAESISSCVSKTAAYGAATSGYAIPTVMGSNIDKNKLYFCESDEKYYYYNNISGEWNEVEDDNIYSAFIQTADGFEFSNLVKINGDLITTGTISADRIDTEELACTRLYAKENPNGYYAKLQGDVGDFGVCSPSAGDDECATGTNCLFGVYHSVPGIGFYTRGYRFMQHSGFSETMYAFGTWDFSDCDDVLGVTARFG